PSCVHRPGCLPSHSCLRRDAYSYTGPADAINGYSIVHGLVQVLGSSSVLVDALEAFDRVEMLVRSAEAGFIREVRCVVRQRDASPTSDGIAQPAANLRRLLLRVHADHANVVEHFDENHHSIRCLHDLIADRRWIRTRPGSARKRAGSSPIVLAAEIESAS